MQHYRILGSVVWDVCWSLGILFSQSPSYFIYIDRYIKITHTNFNHNTQWKLVLSISFYLPFLNSNIIHQYTVSQSNFVLNFTVGTNECIFYRCLFTYYTLVSNSTTFIYLLCFHFTVWVKSFRKRWTSQFLPFW